MILFCPKKCSSHFLTILCKNTRSKSSLSSENVRLSALEKAIICTSKPFFFSEVLRNTYKYQEQQGDKKKKGPSPPISHQKHFFLLNHQKQGGNASMLLAILQCGNSKIFLTHGFYVKSITPF